MGAVLREEDSSLGVGLRGSQKSPVVGLGSPGLTAYSSWQF